jgi:hypothetical protein
MVYNLINFCCVYYLWLFSQQILGKPHFCHFLPPLLAITWCTPGFILDASCFPCSCRNNVLNLVMSLPNSKHFNHFNHFPSYSKWNFYSGLGLCKTRFLIHHCLHLSLLIFLLSPFLLFLKQHTPVQSLCTCCHSRSTQDSHLSFLRRSAQMLSSHLALPYKITTYSLLYFLYNWLLSYLFVKIIYL